jgi:hypothetical protein
MSKLVLPDFKVGMIVVCPSSSIPHITEDKKYVIVDVENDWIMIQDDTDDTRYYQAHLFIEADVYYTMLMWLTLMRLFGIEPKDL